MCIWIYVCCAILPLCICDALGSLMHLVHNLAVLYLSTFSGIWHLSSLGIAQLNCKKSMCNCCFLGLMFCPFPQLHRFWQQSSLNYYMNMVEILYSLFHSGLYSYLTQKDFFGLHVITTIFCNGKALATNNRKWRFKWTKSCSQVFEQLKIAKANDSSGKSQPPDVLHLWHWWGDWTENWSTVYIIKHNSCQLHSLNQNRKESVTNYLEY